MFHGVSEPKTYGVAEPRGELGLLRVRERARLIPCSLCFDGWCPPCPRCIKKGNQNGAVWFASSLLCSWLSRCCCGEVILLLGTACSASTTRGSAKASPGKELDRRDFQKEESCRKRGERKPTRNVDDEAYVLLLLLWPSWQSLTIDFYPWMTCQQRSS